MNKIINQVPYLRASREFPDDIYQLTQEVSKSYLEIANAVNSRTIGIFPVNNQAITGDTWFISGSRRQQTLRQVYVFTTPGAFPFNILHGIDVLGVSQFSPHCYGSFYDAADISYGIIYGSSVAIAGQISFYITPNTTTNLRDGNIVLLSGVGAPTISSGIIVLEWIANI